MLKVVQKLWGVEEWLINDELYCVKFLHIKPGFMCSLHFHPIKDETFLVWSGAVSLEVDKERFHLGVGESKRIKPNTPHRFWTADKYPAVVLEVSTHHDDADVVRIEESKPWPHDLIDISTALAVR